MTDELFRLDAYLRECDSVVTGTKDNGVFLDRTVFYPVGGGQPGDSGVLRLPDGAALRVIDTRKDSDSDQILHICEGELPDGLGGQSVKGEIDWDRRHRLMRVHTLLHLLCALVPAGVTGGSIRDDGTGRLDFDIPESTLDKELLTAELNRLVVEDHPVRARWISELELDANPELVRTMSVQPPRGQGQIRVLEIEDVDLQPCGGTHVARTSEIGSARVRKIEKKGKRNRRVNLELTS